MSENTQTTETPTTPTTVAPLPNSTEARTADGTLLDQAVPPSSTTTPSTEPTKTPDEKVATPETVVPETYAEFKAPEGYTLSKELIENAVPLFKEAGLSQEAAQKFVDFHAKAMLEASKAPQEAYTTMRNEWRGEVLKDPTLASGESLRPEVSSAIAKTIDSLGPEIAAEFRKAMDITGAGDNPAFVRAMLKFSKAVVEGNHVTGRGPSPHGQVAPGAKPTSIASAMYPNLR